jgi:hypothetical protein
MSLPRSLPRVAALLALAIACDGGGFAAPQAAGPARVPSIPVLSRGTGGSVSSRPVTCDPHAPVTSRGVFGPSGGVLVVGGSRLVIPRGALGYPVTITGTALGDSSSTVQFEPHGLRFQAPVQLALSAQGCHLPSGGRPSIVYLGAAGEVLETIHATYLPHQNLVTAPIRHFSGYAILF